MQNINNFINEYFKFLKVKTNIKTINNNIYIKLVNYNIYDRDFISCIQNKLVKIKNLFQFQNNIVLL